MPKVAPVHLKKAGTTVYHDNSACTEINNIESYNVVQGTGGLVLCHRCKEKNDEESAAAKK